MTTDRETFYVIGDGDDYWHYTPEGALVTCWGDPMTAERFETRKEAERCIREEGCSGSGPEVMKVTCTVTVEKARDKGGK